MTSLTPWEFLSMIDSENTSRTGSPGATVTGVPCLIENDRLLPHEPAELAVTLKAVRLGSSVLVPATDCSAGFPALGSLGSVVVGTERTIQAKRPPFW